MTIIGLVMIIGFVIFLFVYLSKDKNKGKNNIKNNKVDLKSNQVIGKDDVNIPKKNIKDFMEFDKISDNMIIQNNSQKYIMVIQCKGINYDLMSEIEQMSVEEGFITFLNTLKFPIQLYIQARAIDLKQNLEIYNRGVKDIENRYNDITNKYRTLKSDIDSDYKDLNKLKIDMNRQANILEYAQDITRYVEKLSLNKNILQRKFYIVLSYNKDEVVTTSDFTEKEIYDICQRELYTRAQSLISALSACSVSGKILNSNELAELLYISYNRDDEKLLDIKAALESGFYRLYSTSKDIFEKKEEAMQKEVEEEAKRRVASAINETLKLQEERTEDELIEEYEERVDREALKIVDESSVSNNTRKVLKDVIAQNHVLGVENRKKERKARKVIEEGKENSIEQVEKKNIDNNCENISMIINTESNIISDESIVTSNVLEKKDQNILDNRLDNSEEDAGINLC